MTTGSRDQALECTGRGLCQVGGIRGGSGGRAECIQLYFPPSNHPHPFTPQLGMEEGEAATCRVAPTRHADTQGGHAVRTELVEIYSDKTNAAVLRHPGRHFPGVLVQGDDLYAL